MEQNKTLKPYLIIGLIISISILLTSCTNVSYVKVSEYHFVNETSYTIKFPDQYTAFNIPPHSTTIFKESINSGGKGAELSDYISPLKYINEKLNISFNATKCLVDVKEDENHSIRNIKEFKNEKIGESNYKFTYTFTEADYNRAVACP